MVGGNELVMLFYIFQDLIQEPLKYVLIMYAAISRPIFQQSLTRMGYMWDCGAIPIPRCWYVYSIASSQKSCIPNNKPNLDMQSCNQKERCIRKYVFPRTQD